MVDVVCQLFLYALLYKLLMKGATMFDVPDGKTLLQPGKKTENMVLNIAKLVMWERFCIGNPGSVFRVLRKFVKPAYV